MRVSHALKLAGCITLAVSLSSCSGSNAGTAEPDLSSFPAVTSSKQISLPFDAYMLTAEQDVLNLKANNLLIKRCAARFGVETTMPVGLNPTPNELNARRYGIVDGKRAQSFGYRPEESPAEAGGKGDWNPSPTEMAVLGMTEATGDLRDAAGDKLPEGGCIGEADRTLGGAQPPAPADVLDVYKSAESDSRVQEAWKSWSSCMKDAGYDYKSPWEPNNAKWPEQVSQKEIDTAVDDVTCRQSTNLVGTWMAVEAAYQRKALQNDPEGFAKMKAWHDDRVRTAAKVLADS
jgi:hypothetical protein